MQKSAEPGGSLEAQIICFRSPAEACYTVSTYVLTPPAFLHTCRDSLEVSADLRVAQYIYMCVNITIEYHTTLRIITTKEIPLLSDS